MSIASEIERLQGVKSDILQAIADKGVQVPEGTALADCPDLITSIPSGGSDLDISDYFTEVSSICMSNMNNSYSPMALPSSLNNDDFILTANYKVPNVSTQGTLGCMFNFNSASSYSQTVYFSCQGGSNPRSFRFGNNYTSVDFNKNAVTNISIEVEAPTQIKFNGEIITISSTPNTKSLTHVWPIPSAFSSAKGNGNTIGVKNFKLIKKSTGAVFLDMIAAKRNLDNAVGLFDLVTGYFYASNYFAVV